MPRMISSGRFDALAVRPRDRGEKGGNNSHVPRADAIRPQSVRPALALVGLALFAPSVAAADNEEVAELRRMVRELQAQNRQLSRRLGALESAREGPARTKFARDRERAAPAPAAAQAQTSTVIASPGTSRTLPEPRDTAGMTLEQRVKELEVGWAAQEHATRQIIQDTLVKTGPKINTYLALSGVIEMVGSRTRDFTGPTKDTLALGTVELDFDVKLSDWLTGSLVLNWESGAPSPTFLTTTATGVDRFTLDRTHILIGDLTRFPIAARLGREVLHFGTSTGVARLDTLSIGTPLTTEVFENRQAAVGFEFAWPTPPLGPPAPPVVVPRAEPQVITPFVTNLARWLGYSPLPQRAFRPVPVTPPPDPPPFYGSFSVYKGSENFGNGTTIEDFNASLGYRTRGHCGKPYEELRSSLVCPWHLDVHVDYNSSVFDSRFLEQNYRPFLRQIGRVPGVAASVKASFGPGQVPGGGVAER